MFEQIEFALNLDDPDEAALYYALRPSLRSRRAGSVIRQALARFYGDRQPPLMTQKLLRLQKGRSVNHKTGNPSKQAAALPGNLVTLGLDIGYGITKAVTDDKIIAFPSVMGHAREIKFQQDEIASRHPGDQISDDEGTWFVGDLALTQLPPGEILRLRGRTANEATMDNAFRLRLAKVAIGKLMQGLWNRDIAHLRIATGLPTDHMRDAAELKGALLGQHLIRTDTAEVVANVAGVMVMPQP